jgi:hypothetical protein
MALRLGSPTPSASGQGGGRSDASTTIVPVLKETRVKMSLPNIYDRSQTKLKAFLL